MDRDCGRHKNLRKTPTPVPIRQGAIPRLFVEFGIRPSMQTSNNYLNLNLNAFCERSWPIPGFISLINMDGVLNAMFQMPRHDGDARGSHHETADVRPFAYG